MIRPARVTNAEVIVMRERRAAGALLKELAYDFNLSLNYVCRIVNGRDRKNVKASV